MSLVLQVALGAALLVGAALKLSAPRLSQSALGTFGVHGGRVRWVIWGLVVAIEAALGVAVILGSAPAAYAAAAMLFAFGLLQAVALARGRRGAPCGCFGPRSRLGPAGMARDLALALGLAALPTLPSLSTDEWLGLGIGVLLVAVTVLAVAVAALAREVGVLRLALGPQAALEIPHEGPEVGSRSEVVERIEHSPGARLALAVFSSDGCHLCQALQSSVAFVADDPLIALRVFDEHRDAGVWQALDVPGAPFAVAMDFDGTVLSKGTFNSLGQLESVLTTAERRQGQAAHVS
jgi:methylamine utilization protein MauE